jgi:hypothetical protein
VDIASVPIRPGISRAREGQVRRHGVRALRVLSSATGSAQLIALWRPSARPVPGPGRRRICGNGRAGSGSCTPRDRRAVLPVPTRRPGLIQGAAVGPAVPVRSACTDRTYSGLGASGGRRYRAGLPQTLRAEGRPSRDVVPRLVQCAMTWLRQSSKQRSSFRGTAGASG